MDLVAITDHDTIAGSLTIADRPDVLVGCEVTASFPEDGVRVHLVAPASPRCTTARCSASAATSGNCSSI